MSRGFKYSLLNKDEQTEQPYFSISVAKFYGGLGVMVLCSFVFCILYTILFNFDEANDTHCKVFNFFPSISAAIGTYTPQKHVWTIAIFSSFLPRLIVPFLYKQYLYEVLHPNLRIFGTIACLLHCVELMALVGLTNWSSSENYPLHKFCFLLFILTSELYMLVSCFVLQRYRKIPATNIETNSLRLKWKLFLFNISCFAVAGYCFLRHSWYCEPGVYSMFALAEYLVVFSNIGFHWTACWDFYGLRLMCNKFGFYLL